MNIRYFSKVHKRVFISKSSLLIRVIVVVKVLMVVVRVMRVVKVVRMVRVVRNLLKYQAREEGRWVSSSSRER